MKTSELTGALLDYWVARADGAGTDTAKMKDGDAWCSIEMVPNAMKPFPACILGNKVGRGKHPYRSQWFYPSTVWAHGGPIIEREKIAIDPLTRRREQHDWQAQIWQPYACATAAAPLVAAMRAYVASKFGDEVSDEPAGADTSKESK